MYCVGGVIYLVGTLVNGFFIGFFSFRHLSSPLRCERDNRKALLYRARPQ